MNISVCMATYNGAMYIREQLDSILTQIEKEDEIIIVDDCSHDDTVKILKGYEDARIKIYINNINMGHVYSFSRAISLCKFDIIFLSDQDDIWIPGRLRLMSNKIIETGALLLSTNFNFLYLNGNIEPLIRGRLKSNDSFNFFNNILGLFLAKRAYFGCGMVFRKELIKYILPIPRYVESHDLWIAFAANILSSNIHLDEITLIRRIHTNNVVNPNRDIISKIKTRFLYMLYIIVLEYRKFKINFIDKQYGKQLPK